MPRPLHLHVLHKHLQNNLTISTLFSNPRQSLQNCQKLQQGAQLSKGLGVPNHSHPLTGWDDGTKQFTPTSQPKRLGCCAWSPKSPFRLRCFPPCEILLASRKPMIKRRTYSSSAAKVWRAWRRVGKSSIGGRTVKKDLVTDNSSRSFYIIMSRNGKSSHNMGSYGVSYAYQI